MFKQVVSISLLIFSVTFVNAQETFSIVAVDTTTGEMGAAGASCVTGSIIISGIIPGIGAMNAQASVCIPNSNLQNGLNFIQARQNASDVLKNTLENDNCFNGDSTNRQYGIVVMSVNGVVSVASYTGSNCMDYKSHITGRKYSIQGNILVGRQVLDSMAARFERTDGDLACKLMAALQGANIPGADSRCLAEATSSQSAFIRVAQLLDPVDSLSLDINVNSTPIGVEPIDSLQKLFDLIHDCEPQDTSTSSNRSAANVSAIKVFPVPSIDRLFFEVSKELPVPIAIEIHGVDGKEGYIRKEIETRTFSVDISTLTAGVYFYSLMDDKGIIGQGRILVK